MASPWILRAALCCVALLAVAATARAQHDDSFDHALTRASELESARRFGEAADMLEALGQRYPEDFALCLHIAYLSYEAQRDARALVWYRRAVALAHGESREAQLGLGYTLLRLGDANAARDVFEHMLLRAPDDVDAREGKNAAERVAPKAVRVWPWLVAGYQRYGGHPYKPASYSISPSLTAVLFDWVLVGASYRLLSYELAHYDASYQLKPAETEHQHEIYTKLGVARKSYALALHYGHVWDRDNALVPANVVGVSGSLWKWAELQGELSLTRYRDLDVFRGALSSYLPITNSWALGPVLSVQHTDRVNTSLGARVRFARAWGALSLEGRGGEEQRPTYLADSLSFATKDRMRGQLSPRLALMLGSRLELTLSYTWQRLLVHTLNGDQAAHAHFLTLGIGAPP